ncbi:MAG: helix-turn-helix domain-containing protein [Oscillospiraceae bacterium]
MIDIESIGSRVKYHRLRNKISQEELAELAQVSRVHISYLERGERIPSMESFINIANALNVSADELLANNLLVTGSNMNSEEQNILFDCSVNERQILLENMRKLKDILRSYHISQVNKHRQHQGVDRHSGLRSAVYMVLLENTYIERL